MIRPAALTALVLLFGAFAASAAPALPGVKAGGVFVLDDCDPDFSGKVAYADNLSYIDGAGKVVFRLTGINTCEMIGSNRQIAYDAERKHVWVAECVGNRIRKLDLEGKEVVTIKDFKSSAIALDPDTGNLWALRSGGRVEGGDTVVFSPAGKELAVHLATGFDLAYDRKGKAFWIAGKDVVKLSTDGKELVRKNVTTWTTSAIAVHPESGKAWVVTRCHPQVPGSKNQLLGFDNAGELKHTIGLGDRTPFHVTLDRKSGAVWLTDFGTGVRRYSADGELELERKIDARCAHADPATGELWVVTREETVRLDADGQVKVRIKQAGPTNQAWIAGP